MNYILTILFIFLCTIVSSQTIQERELDLRSFKSGEGWGHKKDKALELLSIDKFNYVAINYLIQLYDKSNERDSITIFFDELTLNNPDSPTPYLIRAKHYSFERLNYTQRINYLKKGYELDSTNVEISYLLGILYYELFNREYNRNRKKANLDHYVRNSIPYFLNLIQIQDLYIESLRFPLIQLYNYLGDVQQRMYFDNKETGKLYFPVLNFAGLPDDWKTNYSINVFSHVSDMKVSGIKTAMLSINWYSKHLKALDEPTLAFIDTSQIKIFRFTWLRSFDKPVVIGITNKNDSITIYWKMSDGAGGYEPGEIIVNEIRPSTLKDWNNIVRMVNSIDFWNKDSSLNTLTGTDGAQWILEGKKPGKYHVVDRWSGGKIAPVCLELLKLTDLKVMDKDVY